LAFNGAEGDTSRTGGGIVDGTAPGLPWVAGPLVPVLADAAAPAAAFAETIAGTNTA
jgi:hypothetical protein